MPYEMHLRGGATRGHSSEALLIYLEPCARTKLTVGTYYVIITWHQSGALDVKNPESNIRIAKSGLVDEIFTFFLFSHAKLVSYLDLTALRQEVNMANGLNMDLMKSTLYLGRGDYGQWP